ncbi:MAG: FAD-dependent monooxygenase [Gemmatimonadaceae bacterium]|nr:FAD-dependent monooxygenase [Gemmatimonadaceae bacterium]
MTQTPVLIAGAGPTGLVLALWLTKAGVPVRIIDTTAAPGTTSRALGVQARTLELYRQMGIAKEVVEAGYKVEAVNFFTGNSRAPRVPFGDMGRGLSPFPFLLIYPQDEHELMLVRQLDVLGVHVERSTELLSFTQTAEGIRATIKSADGAETKCDARYIAGCDGAHSRVREILGIGFSGGTYAEYFYVADVEATGPINTREISGSLDGSDFVAVFPMRGDNRVRLIGRVHGKAGIDPRDLTFTDVSRHALDRMNVVISKVNWFSTYKVHHRVANSFRSGRAFLLGDAAHIHSPAGGQGMNTGIGDAINLAWKLAAVVKGEASEKILSSYESERIVFARKLVATTDRGFTFATSQKPLIAAARGFLVAAVMPFALRWSELRRVMFRTISQIGIKYRESALSGGKAGARAGGDRLPWVPLEGGDDNFTPLTSMFWQAHIYGEAKHSARAACAELRLPVYVFPWSLEAERAGLLRSAFYLVRPDGYIALADADGGALGLRGYLAARGLSIGVT